MSKSQLNYKTELTAGISMFFSIWTMTFLYSEVMQNFNFPSEHWFVVLCLLFMSGCIFSSLFLRQAFIIGPGLSMGWFFNNLALEGLKPATLFTALLVSSPILYGLTKLKFMQKNQVFLPPAVQEAINIGIGCLFIRFALEQELNNLSTHVFSHPSGYLFLFTILSLLTFKHYQIKTGFILTVFLTTIFGLFTHVTQYHGLFALPKLSLNWFQLNHSDLNGLELGKTILEICLFSLFDTAIGYFCLHQLQIVLKQNHPLKLNQAYKAVSLNNILSALLLSGPNTVFIESTLGIQLGARSPLALMVVIVGFGLFLLCFPFGTLIPKELFQGILFFIGLSLTSPLYKMRYHSLTHNLLTGIVILTIVWQKSILNGLVLSTIGVFFYNLATHTKSNRMIEVTFVLSLIIIILGYL